MAADRFNEELDDVTSPGGVQVGGFDKEDSMVTSVDRVLASRTKTDEKLTASISSFIEPVAAKAG